MKTLLLPMVLLLFGLPVRAQEARLFRSEAVPYDNRHDAAVNGDRTRSSQYIPFKPEVEGLDGPTIWLGQTLEIPFVWTDGLTMLHLENVGQAYSVWVNDRQVTASADGFTPMEYDLTPYIRQGENRFRIGLHRSRAEELQQGLRLQGERLSGSYLFSQQRRSIADYRIALVPDSLRRFGVLKLEIIARNGYNYEEPVNVAYDIYSPEGKLLDFSDRPVTIAGRSQDTLRFSPFIYHTNGHEWGDGRAPLYRVMLFTKRDGKMWEYMPLQIGFSDMQYRDGRWYRFGKPYALKPAACDAGADREATKAAMTALRKQGYNTLKPSFPQPHWYYDLADELGLYVIDCAAISAPDRRSDRKRGGTPANDPQLADEFVRRVQNMYYRSRNHTSVIAFSLGNPSGNGYAMYKAYEWLKSAERERPVFYDDADGEWNCD
ncbi:glycoside hydrolase family 2 TIM barrel-domain containing protein [uncultured Alistipes sp.]|uniref:glycoside hydrolase family 2 TIM barrel-domain containing protein n=1 Tax=uncultured Alistipes sp. TaxID=538949 RepID=UPI0025FA6872|nr:glycoside hydrolase family 2 TIM barrel-domain containing protein [uncultured Alistipes sp.]